MLHVTDATQVDPSAPYLIWRHGAFFRPNARGYTTDFSAAGIYSGVEARRYLDVEGLTVVPVESMKADVEAEIASLDERASRLRAALAQVSA